MYINKTNYKENNLNNKISMREVFSNNIFGSESFQECLSVEFPCSSINDNNGVIIIEGAGIDSMNEKINRAIRRCAEKLDIRNIKKSSSCTYNAYCIGNNIYIEP